MSSPNEPDAASGTPNPNLLDDASAGSLAELLFSTPVVGSDLDAPGDPAPRSPTLVRLEGLERSLPVDLGLARPSTVKPSEPAATPEPWPGSDLSPALSPPGSESGPRPDGGPGSASEGEVASDPSRDPGPAEHWPDGSAGEPYADQEAVALDANATATAPVPAGRSAAPRRRIPRVVPTGSSALFVTRDSPSTGAPRTPGGRSSGQRPLFEGPDPESSAQPSGAPAGDSSSALFGADVVGRRGLQGAKAVAEPGSFRGEGGAPAHDRDLFLASAASPAPSATSAPARAAAGPERAGLLPVSLVEAVEQRWLRAAAVGVLAITLALTAVVALNLRPSGTTDAALPDRLVQIDSAGESVADTMPSGPALAPAGDSAATSKLTAPAPATSGSTPVARSGLAATTGDGEGEPATENEPVTVGRSPVGDQGATTVGPATTAAAPSPEPEPSAPTILATTTIRATTTTRPPTTVRPQTTARPTTTASPTTVAVTPTTAATVTSTIEEVTTTTGEATETTEEPTTTLESTPTSTDPPASGGFSSSSSSTSSSTTTAGDDGSGRTGTPPDFEPGI